MPRTGKVPKRPVQPDPLYKSQLVTKIVNRAMMDGKKSVAQKQIYNALKLIEEKNDNPLKVLRQALENIKPKMEVRSRRIGGAAYQVPVPVSGDRRNSLAIRWLLQAARSRSGRSMAEKLAAEFMDAANSQGSAVKRKDDTHRMAEANRAFAHYRF